jgi:phosphoglycolate phosphatase
VSRFDAAIVDLDGTMVDTLGDFEVALGCTLAELGLPAVDREFIGRTIGKGSEHLLRRTLDEAGGQAQLYDEAWRRYQHHYLRVNGDHAPLYAGVAEGLSRLRAAGLALACVTNKPLAFAQPLLEKKGLASQFACIFGGDSFARRKPDPLPLLEACKVLGTMPARTLVIGDSANDAAAARAARCPVVLVRYGYNHGEPVDSVDADAWVDRLDRIDLGPVRGAAV